MKSLVKCLHKAVECILLDALDTFPSDRVSINRDISRLASLVETRGVPVFTLDFPALGKHFDKCLSEGVYTPSGLPLSGSLKGTVIPKLFSGILLHVFDECGMLRRSPSIEAIAFLRQLYATCKKVRINCERKRVHETLSQFYTEDRELPAPDLNWSEVSWEALVRHCHVTSVASYHDRNSLLRRKLEGWWRTKRRGFRGSSGPYYRRINSGLDCHSLDVVQRVADYVTCAFGEFSPEAYMPKHGPGAVSDLRRYSNKYEFPAWTESLERAFPQDIFAFANYSSWAAHGGLEYSLPSSTMHAVPKTQKGPRLIAAEPTAHMWCQQIVRGFIEQGVAKHPFLSKSVHFRDQTLNQEAARQASSSSKSWTVDLSSASDRVSCRLVERLFRKNPFFLNALIASRTPTVSQDIDRRHPSSWNLRKFSTMGSACTFPLETVVFLIFCISSILISRGQQLNRKTLSQICEETRVFGDDIIIPEDSGEVLEILLTHFSFKVNESKTHRNGKFRESCGLEAYAGVNVTPAYLLQVPDASKPESIISAVECSNNFYKKGWWRTAAFIRDMVPQDIPVVHISSGSFGYVTFGHVPIPKDVRYDYNYHIPVARVRQPIAAVSKAPIQNDSALLQYFTERPDPTTMWKSGVAQRPRLKLRPRWVSLTDLGCQVGIGS